MEIIKASLMAAAMQGGGGGGGSSQDWQDLLGMLHDLFTIPINSKYHFVYQVAMGKDPRFFGAYYNTSYASGNFTSTNLYRGDGESTNTRTGLMFEQYPELIMRSAVYEFITLYENDEPILTWWVNGRAHNLDHFDIHGYYAGNWSDGSYWWRGQRVTEAEYKTNYYSASPHATYEHIAYKSTEYDNYVWRGGSGGFSKFYYYSGGIYLSAYASWGYGYTYDITTRSASIDCTDPATGYGTTPESVTITANTVTQGISVSQLDQSFSLIPAKDYDYLIYTNKTFEELNAAYTEIADEIAAVCVQQMTRDADHEIMLYMDENGVHYPT